MNIARMVDGTLLASRPNRFGRFRQRLRPFREKVGMNFPAGSTLFENVRQLLVEETGNLSEQVMHLFLERNDLGGEDPQ